MKVVVDTNVIVSAFMNTNGTPARILSLILNGNIKILYDNRIIFEYIDVLSRKEFGFPGETINDVIDFMKRDGDYINPVPVNFPPTHLKVNFADESDKKFYEVYKSGGALYLITGNIKHFPKEDTIILPKDFIQVLENSA